MKLIFIIFATLVCMSSCSPTEEQKDMALLEEAIYYLNKQEYSKAISILETLESDSKVEELLSSAYAGKAGFNSAKIADIVLTSEGNSIRILYGMTKNYSIENLEDSQIALEKLSQILNKTENNKLKVQYASIQIYKVSQLLMKNYLQFSENSNIEVNNQWNPCSEAQLLAVDLKEIILSLNRAILSLRDIESSIDSFLLKLQSDLNINPNKIENYLIDNIDIDSIRISISREYAKFLGQENADEIACSSNSQLISYRK